MSEHFHPDHPASPISAPERLAEVRDTARALTEISEHVAQSVSETPAGKARLLCNDAGLAYDEAIVAPLLKEPPLSVFLAGPLPLAPPMHALCIASLSAALDAAPMSAPSPVAVVAEASPPSENTEIAKRRLTLDQSEAVNAQKRERNTELMAERDASMADLDGFLRRHMMSGTLAELRDQTPIELAKVYDGEQLRQYVTLAEMKLAAYEKTLTSVASVFSGQELERVFGGDLVNSVRLNLAGSSNETIYADVFARIDAGFAHDDERRQHVRTAVAARLGIAYHDVKTPTDASDLQDVLAKGRGTEHVTETRLVRDPETGEMVAREVVVREMILPFTERDRLVLSNTDPRVTTYPDPAGGTNYRIIGEVEGGAPISIWREVPNSGSFPAVDINNAMNELFVDALFRNRGMAGGIQDLFGLGDAAFGVATDVDPNAIGRTDLVQGFVGMFVGENTSLGNRFLTDGELAELGDGMRHLAPDGDFGVFNQMDPVAAAGLMRALFGEGHAQILANMERARPFINTGRTEAPSFQRLYAKLHPEDADGGYSRLREIVGEDGIARLSLHPGQDGSMHAA